MIYNNVPLLDSAEQGDAVSPPIILILALFYEVFGAACVVPNIFLIICFYFVILQLRTIQIGYRKIIGIRKKEMKQLKENEGVERSLLLAMAVIAGLTVANCYYN